MGAVQMRQPRVRVQWADHRRGRQLSLVFALFTLEPVGVHMVYRGEADTLPGNISCLHGKKENERRHSFGDGTASRFGCERLQRGGNRGYVPSRTTSTARSVDCSFLSKQRGQGGSFHSVRKGSCRDFQSFHDQQDNRNSRQMCRCVSSLWR